MSMFLLPQEGWRVSKAAVTQPHHWGCRSLNIPLTLAAGQWQRWGGWPVAKSGSHLTAPCWEKLSLEQTLWPPWQAGLQPQTGADLTPCGMQRDGNMLEQEMWHLAYKNNKVPTMIFLLQWCIKTHTKFCQPSSIQAKSNITSSITLGIHFCASIKYLHEKLD